MTSHTQALILSGLCEEWTTGADLREYLARNGSVSTAESFYQVMGRMKSAGLIKRRFNFPKTSYRIEPKGKTELAAAKAFYANL